MIALAKKKTDVALELVGDDTPALGFVGCATWLAYAIHLEARERAGRPSDAILDVIRRHGDGHYALVLTYQHAFRLARASQTRLEEKARKNIWKATLLAALWVGLPVLAAGLLIASFPRVLLAAIFLATVAAFAKWSSFRPFATRWPAASLTGRILLQLLSLVAVAVALLESPQSVSGRREIAPSDGVPDLKTIAETRLRARDFVGAEAAAEQCLARAPDDADCRRLKAEAQAGPFLQEP